MKINELRSQLARANVRNNVVQLVAIGNMPAMVSELHVPKHYKLQESQAIQCTVSSSE